jgi:renalase
MRIAIVGAGMSGLACAERLAAGGHAVTAFDKGRGAGGRMATRRLATPAGDVAFDHGAQYFTTRDPAFLARVARWEAAGVVAAWPAAAPDARVGTPGMNAPLRAMAAGLDVRWGTRIDALGSDGSGWTLRGDGVPDDRFDAVVVAVPAEQARPLLAPWDAALAALAEATPSQPCWTGMAAFAERLAVEADVVREDADPEGVLGWAARNGARPGRVGPGQAGAEAWVIQAGPDWSAQHLEDDAADVLASLLQALARATGAVVPAPTVATAHRWRFARSGAVGRACGWNAARRLGACGDWWLGPRVECAWLSGDALATAIGAS